MIPSRTPTGRFSTEADPAKIASAIAKLANLPDPGDLIDGIQSKDPAKIASAIANLSGLPDPSALITAVES